MGTPSFVIGSVGLVVATAGMVAARSSGGCRRAARVLLALPSAVVLLGLLGACNDTGGTAGAAAPVAVMTAASAPVPTASGTPTSTPTSTAAAGTGVVAAVPPAVTGPASSPAGSAAPAADVLPVPARTTIRAQVPPAPVRTTVPAAAPVPLRTTVPVRTTVPAAAPVPLRTTVPAAASGRCDPSYPDVCLRTGIGDYDCAGGSGNGPNYVQGPVRVLRPDPFGLDADGDGTGCQRQS